MDILFLLIPLSAVLVLAIVAVFGWAVHSGSLTSWNEKGSALSLKTRKRLMKVKARASGPRNNLRKGPVKGFGARFRASGPG
jgi:hypothetical protein